MAHLTLLKSVEPVDIDAQSFVVKDSGNRREFDTGARRDMADDKPRPALISPFALMRIGKWMAMGAINYGDRNWEKGIPFSSFIESTMRHLLKYMMGMRDEDHLAAICFNVMDIMHFEETGRTELDDLPRYQLKGNNATTSHPPTHGREPVRWHDDYGSNQAGEWRVPYWSDRDNQPDVHVARGWCADRCGDIACRSDLR